MREVVGIRWDKKLEARQLAIGRDRVRIQFMISKLTVIEAAYGKAWNDLQEVRAALSDIIADDHSDDVHTEVV